MNKSFLLSLAPLCVLLFLGCANIEAQNNNHIKHKLTVIFDTDANNELDDQHVLAYLFFNSSTFNIKAITVNATRNGGNIDEAKKHTNEKLIVIAVGKLTNIALALKKEPAITKNIRLVWLGANYPEPGEYNLANDIPSMNFLLKTNIDFEMVTVRYGSLQVPMQFVLPKMKY